MPEEVQHINLETLIPPWTVTRQVYIDSLTSHHSGISNDIVLFSDIGLSLTHHYRVHKRGGRSSCRISQKLYVPAPHSAAPTCGSVNRGEIAGSWKFVSGRFCRCYGRLVSTVETHVCSPAPNSDQRETPRRIAPRLTEQDTLAVAGSMVFDCQPQVLPGAIDVNGTELAEIRSTTRAGVATAAPPEREQSFGGGGGGTC